MSDLPTPVTHAREIFHGFDLTKISHLQRLSEALERKFAPYDPNDALSDLRLTREQSDTLEELQRLITEKEPAAELAKEFMRMILAAPDLVKDEDMSLSNRELGLRIVGAALCRGGMVQTSSARKSVGVLENSFVSGGMDGKKEMGGGFDKSGLNRHATFNIPKKSTSSNKLDIYEDDDGDDEKVQQPTYIRTPKPKLRVTIHKPTSSGQPSSSRDDPPQTPFGSNSLRRSRQSSSPTQDSSGSEYENDDTKVAKSDKKKKKDTPAQKRQKPYRSPTQSQDKGLRPGDRPVDVDIDRFMAEVGKWNPLEMCKFEFDTVCSDPDKPGREMAGRPVLALYAKGDNIDFDDSRDIRSLNNWRKIQIGIIDSALDGYAAGGEQTEEDDMEEIEDVYTEEEEGGGGGNDDFKVGKRSTQGKRHATVESGDGEHD